MRETGYGIRDTSYELQVTGYKLLVMDNMDLKILDNNRISEKSYLTTKWAKSMHKGHKYK